MECLNEGFKRGLTPAAPRMTLQSGLTLAVNTMIHSHGTQVAAAMQRLEEIAEEIYKSSAAGKDGAAQPRTEALPADEASNASEAAAQEGSCRIMLTTPGSVRPIYRLPYKQATVPLRVLCRL